MRIALDQNGKLINIRDINSGNKGNKYYCPYCKTEVIVASFEGDYSTYFRAKNEHNKNSDCKYISDYSEKSNNIIDKHSLEDIFEGGNSNEKDNVKQDNNNDNHNNNDDVNTFNVHTTKQLYAYCRANDYNTEYLDGLKIKDFFINKDTLDYNMKSSFVTITGIKLIEGEIIKYEKIKNNYSLIFKVKSDNNTLILKAKTLSKNISLVYNYNMDKSGTFQGNKIVLLGNWYLQLDKPTDNEYPEDLIGKVNSIKNIIYRF